MRKMLIFALAVLFTSFALAQDAYLHLNKIIARLEQKKIANGIWVSALHPANAVGLVDFNGYLSYQESMSKPMIDYILIDMEHQPYDISALRDFYWRSIRSGR